MEQKDWRSELAAALRSGANVVEGAEGSGPIERGLSAMARFKAAIHDPTNPLNHVIAALSGPSEDEEEDPGDEKP